jgi:ABC-2 type transport system permease protein
MPSQILTIARNTFLESIRQPFFFIIIVLAGIFQYLNTWGAGFSMSGSDTAEVSGDDKLLLDIGLATVFVCGMLLAAFIATAVVSREIENKTILTVVSKPISRSAVVIGKYLGVAAAILIAVCIMLAFLMFAVRHGVMSKAADTVDGPVVTFALSAVLLAVVIGAVCNYMYGWPFSQTTILVMLPAVVLGYILVLFIDKNWSLQPLYHFEFAEDRGWRQYTREEWIDRHGRMPEDTSQVLVFRSFKPQITIASYCLTLAILVLTAVAIAVSTRLGQVMTIVVCSGVFLFGLLSNHFLGRHAYHNQPVAEVVDYIPGNPRRPDFQQLGDTYQVRITTDPRVPITPGMPFYWGPNPNGFALATPPFPPVRLDLSRDERALLAEDLPPSIIVTEVRDDWVTIRNSGREAVPVRRPPERGDHIFVEPTRFNMAFTAVWAVVPNLHFFWLVDAVSQNAPIPFSYVRLLTLYSLAQIGALLALGILLFQRRDVG